MQAPDTPIAVSLTTRQPTDWTDRPLSTLSSALSDLEARNMCLRAAGGDSPCDIAIHSHPLRLNPPSKDCWISSGNYGACSHEPVEEVVEAQRAKC